MEKEISDLLIKYAKQFETRDFINGDPSWFMHQVSGRENQETMAFIASCLSYGSRKQFMPKIQYILDLSKGDVYKWVRDGLFLQHVQSNDRRCFYRLYTYSTMHHFLCTYQQLLQEHETLGKYVKSKANDGYSAVSAICSYFGQYGISVVVPKDARSACKRVCMFLRWMVRDESPVDLGLWSDFIDKKTLIMPLDTHVVNQSIKLGLLKSKNASMSAALQLTKNLTEVFPEDPLKGDFALFGVGVNEDK